MANSSSQKAARSLFSRTSTFTKAQPSKSSTNGPVRRKPLFSSREPVELSCMQSLMPLHSATASNSMLSSKVGQWGSLSEAPPTITSYKSYYPIMQNDYLNPSSCKLLSTTATENSLGENEETKKISVTFFNADGEQEIKVPVGMSMLEAAHENDIELEGACEGSLACSTCHVIVMDVEQYNKLEDPTDEENDMLDLAFGLTETSRLGCQVIAKPELDGLHLALPAATRNFAVDGYKPKPH